MGQTATAPLITWSRAFPGTPAQVSEARRFLAGLLGGCRAAEDAVLCLSELASNAILHSRSARPDGCFTVRVQVDGCLLRVEVCDEGGPWTWPADPGALHGRGLLIVAQLAAGWGRAGNSATGWRVWYEIDCPLAPPREPPARPTRKR